MFYPSNCVISVFFYIYVSDMFADYFYAVSLSLNGLRCQIFSVFSFICTIS